MFRQRVSQAWSAGLKSMISGSDKRKQSSKMGNFTGLSLSGPAAAICAHSIREREREREINSSCSDGCHISGFTCVRVRHGRVKTVTLA